MPAKHVGPKDIETFFNRNFIPYEDTPEFWDKVKKLAYRFGLTASITNTNKISIEKPDGKVAVYTDMPINLRNISIALYHEMMRTKLHPSYAPNSSTS